MDESTGFCMYLQSYLNLCFKHKRSHITNICRSSLVQETFPHITANNSSCRAPRPHLMILMLTFLSLAWMKSTKSLVSVKSSALASERVIRSSNFLLPELVVVGGPSFLQQEIVKSFSKYSYHQNGNSPVVNSFPVVISRPGRSQGLLHKHFCHSLIH